MRTRLAYAGFGVLATLVGVGLAHLVAALTDPASSPVLAVGSQVIDLTPTPVKNWAIATFGNKDKPILIGSVMAGVLVLAAVAGVIARRRLAVGAGMLVALVGVAAAATANRPDFEVVDLLPSIAAAVAGVASLVLLVRLAHRVGDAKRSAAAASGDLHDHTPADPDTVDFPSAEAGTSTGATAPRDHSDDSDDAAEHGSSSTDGARPSRRGVLIATGVLAAAAAAMGTAGQWIAKARTRITDVDLPAAAKPAPPLPTGLEQKIPQITPLRIPNDKFYRVDTRLSLPVIDFDDWTLTIDGDVENEMTLTFDDLKNMPLIERDITLTCVSNDVGGRYVGGARWLGVPLQDLFAQAKVGSGADQIFSVDVDGMTISTPLEIAKNQPDAMIAIGMNGEALPLEHGFPARLIVPGLYGFISATKWISKMTLTTYAEQDAYWTKKKWATDAPIKIASRVDTPKPLARIEAGKTFVGGIAWAQANGGVAKVEVKLDGGAWQEAELGPDVGNVYWRQWFMPYEAKSGQHTVAVRATAGDGTVQTAARATPFPEGSSGVQETIFTVL